MSTPVRDEPPPEEAEELVLGPRARREQPRWVPRAALLLGAILLIAAAMWHFWPRPVAPLSLSDLQDTYAGMVRSDGSNDASVLTRQTVQETPVTVTPSTCSPLVEATFANRFPDAALDGVGTYWLDPSAISLFTLRFPDTSTAAAERERIRTALDGCVDSQILIGGAPTDRSSDSRVTVGRIAAGTGGDDEQLGYTLTGPDGLLAIQLMPYLNTLTWQFRYEADSTSYSPLAADRLMQSLRAQLDEIVASRS